ncbi:MAG: low molecular weight phosphatase family protein [Planctomycetota bacterium]
MPTVLFLCTGNYYRSRFCEAWFNHLAKERGLDWRADSRGLALDPLNPGNIYRVTVAELAKRGVDTAEHEARPPLPAERGDFDAADRVVAVKEAEHRAMMEAGFPDLADSITYWHVHDLDCATSDEAIPQLEHLVLRLVDELATNAG